MTRIKRQASSEATSEVTSSLSEADILELATELKNLHGAVLGLLICPKWNEDVPADPIVARWLGVPAGTPVLERARRQGVRGEPPKQLSTTWFIPEVAERLPILRQLDTGPGGAHSRMEEIGYVLYFEDIVTCRRALPEECERLELAAGDPVLTIWRRCYDQNDRVIEVNFRVIPGDRLEQIYRYTSHS